MTYLDPILKNRNKLLDNQYKSKCQMLYQETQKFHFKNKNFINLLKKNVLKFN